MKRFSIYFLAFLTFWTSTWLVTDIHDLSIVDADHAHQVIIVQQDTTDSEHHTASHEHEQHCGVCSYDHGGHMGQTLATLVFASTTMPAQKTNNSHLKSDFWYSRDTTPKLRPPIV